MVFTIQKSVQIVCWSCCLHLQCAPQVSFGTYGKILGDGSVQTSRHKLVRVIADETIVFRFFREKYVRFIPSKFYSHVK